MEPEKSTPAVPPGTPEPRVAPSGAQLNVDELAAWRGFLRAHARVTRALDDELVAAHSLPLTSYEVLLFLEDAPDGVRISDLADTMLLSHSGRARLVDRLEQGGVARGDAAELADSVLLSRSGLIRIVDRLEQRELVRRENRPSGAFAVLTDRGQAALLEARDTHLSGVRRRFLERFSVEEQRALGGYFDRILEWMEGEEAAG